MNHNIFDYFFIELSNSTLKKKVRMEHILDKFAVGALGSDAYAAIRGREQQMIDYFGGVGSINVGNRIRGVSKTNPLGRTYHTKSNQMFGQLHQYTGF